MTDSFANLPRNHFGAILCDPPWRFEVWSGETVVKPHSRNDTIHYDTMSREDLQSLPVKDLAAPDCVLFMWVTWPTLVQAMELVGSWGFKYKTCAFDWMKANAGQLDMLRDDADALMGMGYWTRSNSEPCLLATRGKPKRLNADVRQGIIEPRREHSRKPACVHERIQRLVDGPYLELFARAPRVGWDVWGNQTSKFAEASV